MGRHTGEKQQYDIQAAEYEVSHNKDIKKDILEKITNEQPEQTEAEIFIETDTEGYNHNSSEQNAYPGIQRHTRSYQSTVEDEKMPYQKNAELPENVVKHLPLHAQDIYREAFNHALEEYKDPHKRRDSIPLDKLAHKVAWAAVKNKYEEDPKNNKWKLKNK